MYQHKQIIIRRAYYKYLSFKLFFSTTILHLSNNLFLPRTIIVNKKKEVGAK